MAFLGESLWIAGLWKGMVDLWKRGWREGLTAQIKTFLFNEQKHNSKKNERKKNGTKKSLIGIEKLVVKIPINKSTVFDAVFFPQKEVNILFGCWLPHFTSPLSFLPSHASQYQLSVLKELVYGCKLVFNRENWEVFRVPEADLPPPDSFQTYRSFFLRAAYVSGCRRVKIKARGL